jgi:hypothetical protein
MFLPIALLAMPLATESAWNVSSSAHRALSSGTPPGCSKAFVKLLTTCHDGSTPTIQAPDLYIPNDYTWHHQSSSCNQIIASGTLPNEVTTAKVEILGTVNGESYTFPSVDLCKQSHAPCPVAPGAQTLSYQLPSNHDCCAGEAVGKIPKGKNAIKAHVTVTDQLGNRLICGNTQFTIDCCHIL